MTPAHDGVTYPIWVCKVRMGRWKQRGYCAQGGVLTRRRAMGVAIGLGLAVERVLYEAPVGWLYAVFVAALILATLILNEAKALRSFRLLVAAAGIITLFVEPHWASFLLAFLGAISVALAGQASVARDAWQWLRNVGMFALMIPSALVVSGIGGLTKLAVPNLPASLATGVRQWIFPLTLTTIFLVLFLIGNPLMADSAASIFNFLIGEDSVSLSDLIVSGLRVGIIALLCWPFLSVPDLEIPQTESSLCCKSTRCLDAGLRADDDG